MGASVDQVYVVQGIKQNEESNNVKEWFETETYQLH